MKKILTPLIALLKDATTASMEMFKVMIPIIILVKILQEFGLIEYLAWPLTPIMGPLGLPAEMGLVWATALINNIYSGLIVFLSITADSPLSIAQSTVLSILILVAHGLPLESSIARKSGARFIFQCFIRILGAFILALIVHTLFDTTGILQEPATILFQANPLAGSAPSLALWALDQGKNLLSIFGIILALLGIMRILHAIRLIALINWLLRPLLKLIGIGPKASAITVIGLTMGLSYGGGLIINETRNNSLAKEDIFYSLTLMGLCHSLIEDTLLLMLIGANFTSIFWGRLVFALVAMAGIVQIVRTLPVKVQNTYLWVNK